MHMLHHLSIGAVDIERAARFYDATLAPLGYLRVWSDLRPGQSGQAVGYGPPGEDDKFAVKQIAAGPAGAPGAGGASTGMHVAFGAASREAVAAFHAAALAAGGRDNGAPGLRPHYGPHYYAAFVLDPEGWRLEAVFNSP
jgi:catechol 2,3-dioxygenase-like lactoylglutathione lyase family enzyme